VKTRANGRFFELRIIRDQRKDGRWYYRLVAYSLTGRLQVLRTLAMPGRHCKYVLVELLKMPLCRIPNAKLDINKTGYATFGSVWLSPERIRACALRPEPSLSFDPDERYRRVARASFA
jgi:hypothetical protein